MDKIEISDDQIVPLDNIAPGLRGLRLVFVNVFGVTHTDGTWTLIDAGLARTASRIRDWADASFGRPPNAIVLTHGHPDHVGDVAAPADGWDCPIFAHELEAPYLTGKASYPAPDWKAGGGLMPLLATVFPKGPFDLGNRLKLLPGDGSEVQSLPGWTLLHTPGHTPGHVSFFREGDRTLLVGDAFCTTKPESFFDSAFAPSCTGRRPTSRRTGQTPAPPSNGSPRSTRSPSRWVTASRSPANPFPNASSSSPKSSIASPFLTMSKESKRNGKRSAADHGPCAPQAGCVL